MNKIYVLIDPITNENRYVGFTSEDLEKRLKRHIQLARQPHKDWVHNWIYQLLNKNTKPIISLLEIVEEQDDWQNREIFWIQKGRELGWRLTNLTIGGEGSVGFKHSLESKQKMSDIAKNRSVEINKKISNANKGKKASEETRRKMSNSKLGKNNPIFGKGHTKEAREKMSKNKKRFFGKDNHFFNKRHSEETKKKISESLKGKNNYWFGKHHSEETKRKMSESAKRRNQQKMANLEPIVDFRH